MKLRTRKSHMMDATMSGHGGDKETYRNLLLGSLWFWRPCSRCPPQASSRPQRTRHRTLCNARPKACGWPTRRRHWLSEQHCHYSGKKSRPRLGPSSSISMKQSAVSQIQIGKVKCRRWRGPAAWGWIRNIGWAGAKPSSRTYVRSPRMMNQEDRVEGGSVLTPPAFVCCSLEERTTLRRSWRGEENEKAEGTDSLDCLKKGLTRSWKIMWIKELLRECICSGPLCGGYFFSRCSCISLDKTLSLYPQCLTEG